MPETPIIYVLNGPNLNLLGTREPASMLEDQARLLGLSIDMRQSNHEGHLIDWMHEANSMGAKAILLNAAGYSHTSIALHDAIKAINVPVFEVHISDPHKREAFRHHSYVSENAVACFAGHGAKSYTLALDAAAKL
jgi:3-dehydroquinate dehydratase-2